MRIGYCRVSTPEQSLTVQLETLKAAGCERLYREKISGAAPERPELERLLDQVRQGDTVIVTKLDRLARSTKELLEIVERIQEAGAGFQSLAEPWADTTNHAGKLIMTVFAGIAEFERERIKERCKEGVNSAQQRGVPFGRPRALDKDQRVLLIQLREQGKSVPQMGRLFNVSEATIRRAIQQHSRQTKVTP